MNVASTTAPWPGTNTASSPPASMTRSSVAGDDGDQVVTGVAAARLADRHCPLTEVDDGGGDLMLGYAQRRDRTVHLAGVGAVTQRVGAQLVGALGDRCGNFGAQ
jgi:hypothetical protein